MLTICFDSTFEDYDDDYDDDDDEYDRTITIDAVNLLSLSCRLNPTIDINPVNLTSVVDVCIDFGNDFRYFEEAVALCAVALLRGLSSVKSLIIGNNILECLYLEGDSLRSLPSFHNLTHLYVYSVVPETTSVVLTDILQKAPKLEVLYIPSLVLEYLDGEYSIWNSVPCCVKSSLNQLCILDFNGDEREIEFVRLLLKTATYLGEIKIFCSSDLLADREKMADVWKMADGLRSCVIKFYYSFYESSNDGNDESASAANTDSSHIKDPDLEEMHRCYFSQHDESVQQAFEAVSRMDTEKRLEFKTKMYKIVEERGNQLLDAKISKIVKKVFKLLSCYQQQLLPPPPPYYYQQYQQQPLQHTNYRPNMNQLSLYHYYQSQLPVHSRVQSPGHPHLLPLAPPFVTPNLSNHATFRLPKLLELYSQKIVEEVFQNLELDTVLCEIVEELMNQ